jgi:hypothetical protein
MDTTLIRLKNGSDEPRPLVSVTTLVIRSLLQSDPISFYELVMKARDPKHEIFSPHQTKVLTDLGFLDHNGRVHQSIANVLLSAVTGEGLEMTLGDPVAR